MKNGIRFTLGSVLAVLVLGSALAEDTSRSPNYQGLWWNSPPGSESGWGISLAHQGDVILATWLTYGVGGEARWLALNARKMSEGIYSGALVESRGPAPGQSFDPILHRRFEVGSGTLSFSDPANGNFSYTHAATGVRQAKTITRQVFGPTPSCAASSRADLSTATNYTDQWCEAGATGSEWRGINLAHQGDVILATWFTYDLHRSPLWLSLVARRVGSSTYSGSLIQTTGPAFDGTPFDPARVTRTALGTATLTFANGNLATFAYTLDGVTRTQAITRFLLEPASGTRCCEKIATPVKGKVFDGSLEAARVCADANGNGRCDPGEVQALSDAAGAYELNAPADFDGPLVAEVIAGQTRAIGPAGAAVDRSYRMASPSPAYGTHVTPFTTLVRLSGQRDYRLAEEIVRNELGLPPGFAINATAAPAAGSLAQVVAKSVAGALAATDDTLDHSAPDAFANVAAAFPPALTDLPQLRIATKDGAPIVSKEVYLEATFAFSNPATSPPEATLNGKIRGRGNFTWLGPKKPYKVQFANDTGWAKVTDVLGMKKNRNWALLADYNDRSLIRNKLAMSLGNSSLFSDGLKWNPSGQHVEVTVNGEYAGVYLLSEDIRIDPARLAIRAMSSSPAAHDCEGGFLVEVDLPLDCYNDGKVNLQIETPLDVHFCIKSPDEGAITQEQCGYINSYLAEAEKAIHGSGDLTRINPVSYVDWYLLNELFRNWDAPFFSSAYMWKDAGSAPNPGDRLLNMGPLWDFDISAGNVPFQFNWEPQGCWVSKSERGQVNWFTRLLEIPEFLDLTLARWKDKRPALEQLVDSSITAFTRRLDGEQQRNFARWPVLRGTVQLSDHFIFSTYEEHVAFLRGFMRERIAWLDKAYESRESFAALCR